MNKLFRNTLLALFLCPLSYIYAQKVNLTDTLSIDPNVRIGKLDNGLVYYIRQNKKPENRIEMRLAVNAGSMMETDFQKGLAHFTEHMCFNGTTNFPKNELVDYLQKTGVKFGADINAYTSFDETVYMLQLPADNKELVDKGIQVLEDWAHNVTFDDKEIEKERGVITEEWRLGLGADDRMRKKYFPIIFKDSRYAERLPIGDINIIQNFKHDTIRSFYHDWYRPNLQAVIIVGDFDVAEMEKKVIEHFSGLKNPENMKPRISYDIPANIEPLVAITTDKEATSTNIQIFFKHPRMEMHIVADYRTQMMNELYTGMLNERLKEYMQDASSPFVYAYNYYGGFLARNGDAYAIIGMIKENMIEKGLELLLTENERVRRFGFLQTELDRMKDDMLSRYEKTAKEFDKTESARFAREYVSNYLSAEPIPGAKTEFKYVKSLLPDITLEEINALTAKWITAENLVLVITAPDKPSITIPSEERVQEIVRDIQKEDIQPYVDNFKTEPLLEENLSGSAVAKRTDNEQLGFSEIVLKNGIKIIVKTTDFKNDEILFSAISPGGSSLYPDEDYISALFSSQIVAESGVGKFDNVELEKKLKGKTLEINPYIDNIKEGFTGRSSPKDLETLFQLTYLYFKQARRDSLAFDANISRTKNQLKFIGSNPVFAFMDTLIKTSSNNDPRVIVLPKEKQLNQITLDKVFKIYSDRFANAGDFTFFLVGNVNIDSITPLLEKYIGSLPITGRVEKWKDESAGFPAGATNITVHKGTEPKSMVGIVLQENIEWNDENRLYIRMLKEAISIKLIEIIREAMSGVYSPKVQLSVEKYPKSEYSLMIMFGCSPKNANKLTKAVFGIIDKLRKSGPEETDLKKVQELLIRERETDLKNNKWWLSKIENLYFQGDDPGKLEDFNTTVNCVTQENLKLAAQKFFVKDHYVRVVLLPEKK
jgi:zinc protease